MPIASLAPVGACHATAHRTWAAVAAAEEVAALLGKRGDDGAGLPAPCWRCARQPCSWANRTAG